MRNKRLLFFEPFLLPIFGVMSQGLALAQVSPIDVALAREFFLEAHAVCEKDAGKLWGISLAGPILFVDPKTRAVVASQSDHEGQLTKENEVFIGTLPAKLNIANTAIDWAGVKWTMVIWPLPGNKDDRARLLLHELWHRIQDQIGFPSSGPANNHLDSLEGRIWLQLEWRALAASLTQKGAARLNAARNALFFRAYRRELFPKAASEERELEMHEGLAEYTGIKLSGMGDVAAFAAAQLKTAEKTNTFVRSFAYASGPAYGILLDESGTNWRQGLKPDNDLGNLLAKSLSLKPPQHVKQQASKAAKNYDGDSLRAAETEREKTRLRLIATYRAQLVDGPVLAIPLHRMNMQFNPNNLQPLDELGTVYPEIRIVDVWGVLTVSAGALMSPTFQKVTVVAPGDASARPLRGDGWTLELKSGWTIAAAERHGDFVIRKAE